MSTTEAAHLAATTSTQICRKCDSLFQYSSIAGADNPENKTAGPSKIHKYKIFGGFCRGGPVNYRLIMGRSWADQNDIKRFLYFKQHKSESVQRV